MPGSVSDAYDPEFGTAANAATIAGAIRGMYLAVSGILGDKPPINVVELVRCSMAGEMPTKITATLTEGQWRLIRFALERAGEAL